jgi:hypothetical protein
MHATTTKDIEKENNDMETNDIAALSTQMSQIQLGDKVGTAVLKKAIDIQNAAAAQLIEALPAPPSNPENLGQNIDTQA